MRIFSFFGAAVCLAGAVTAAMAGEKSAPAKVQAAQAPAVQASTTALVVKGNGCGCDGGFGSGRTTFAERRASRVESRSAKRGACGSCGSCATTAVEVTEVPAVIRTESIYRTQKVGQKTVIVPATQASTPASKAGK